MAISSASLPPSLPHPRTRLIGREAELATARVLLLVNRRSRKGADGAASHQGRDAA